jgi:AraC-like DNA-binding protein
MIFVPLSLFASFLLAIVLVWFARTHDLSHRAHKLFFALVALYAIQSLLITLRWGYDVTGAASAAALLAPVLPVVAYLSYSAITGPLRPARLWPLIFIPLNWLGVTFTPDIADAMILMTFLGFGGLLIRLAWKGPDQMTLAPLENAREIVVAMALTGLTLVASGLTDIYVIVDFIRNDGRHIGFIVSFVQSAFVLVIGACAALGRVSQWPESDDDMPAEATDVTQEDDANVMAKLEDLHRNEELSLRRIARRLGVPDRKVSLAINRRTGLSVSQFVNNYRIKDACRMLAKTQDTVLTVSLAAGFATKSNFNREFVRVTGTSPSTWRKENAGSDARQ